MPFDARPIDMLPGIFKEASEYASQGRYVDGSNVRFWKGFPERIGGNSEISSERAYRPPRGMVAWRSLDGTQLTAFGHARGVQVLVGGDMYDITPTGAGGYETLSLTVGSITSGPYTAGETVTTAAGGSGRVVTAAAATPVSITHDNGTHLIDLSSVSGAFVTGETITAGSGGTARILIISGTDLYVYAYSGTWTASASVTGSVSGAIATLDAATALWVGETLTGGSSGATSTVSAISESGAVNSGATTLYGEGIYGTSVWGGVESIYSTVSDATTWTLDLWGEDLIANAREGGIYVLDTSVWIGDTTTRMGQISGAPADALGIFMNADNRTLVAYGAHDGSASDPLNIRWCDEEDYTTWGADTDNTAGSIRCEDGSLIVGRMSARSGHLISTDTAVYLFRYIGLPFVFSLTKVAQQGALIGPYASAELDGITYWMGTDGFYYYDGSVGQLPCDVHAYVFGRLNVVQSIKVCCSTVRAYNEVWWFYASSGVEIDSYVAYNTVEKTWHIGDKARTAWIDTSAVLSYPTGCEIDGTVNAEELGGTDNGASIAYTLQTSDMEIDDGTLFLQARKLIPDYDSIEGTHSVTITTRGYPARAERTKGPYSVSSATEDISVRSRGRVMSFLFAGSDPFRMGRWRYRVAPHGQKDG